jgi:hypothetical protein
MFLKIFKKGEIVVDNTIRWIIWIGILVAVGFAVRSIVLKVSG